MNDESPVPTMDRPSPVPRPDHAVEQPAEGAKASAPGRSPWWRRPKRRACVILAALVVLVAAADGILWWQASDFAATDAASSAATAAAGEAVPTVLSYTYANLDGYPAKATAATTGRFKEELSALIEDRVIPAATRKQIVTRTTVQAMSTVSAEPESVVLLLFVNQSTRTEDSATPRLEGARLRVTMERVDDAWLISELKPV